MEYLKKDQVISQSHRALSERLGQNYLSAAWCLSRAHHLLQICFHLFWKQKVHIHIENVDFPVSDAQFCFVSPCVQQTVIARFSHCLTRSMPQSQSLLKKSISILTNQPGTEDISSQRSAAMNKEPSFPLLPDFNLRPIRINRRRGPIAPVPITPQHLHFSAKAPIAVATEEFNTGLSRATAGWLPSGFQNWRGISLRSSSQRCRVNQQLPNHTGSRVSSAILTMSLVVKSQPFLRGTRMTPKY